MSVHADTAAWRLPTALAGLADTERWCAWRHELVEGRWTKVPHSAKGGKARSNTPATWARWTAVKGLGEMEGPGLMLGGGLQGVDLDACLTEGVLELWAREIVERIDTYTEVSPSGRGVKLFFYGPEGGSSEVTFGDAVDFGSGTKKRREIAYYTSGRYFTVTGTVFVDSPLRRIEVADANWLRQRIEDHRQHNKKPAAKKSTGRASGPDNGIPAWLTKIVEHGVPDGERSEAFYKVVRWLYEAGSDAAAITAFLEQYPNGIASKYVGRIAQEVKRCIDRKPSNAASDGVAADDFHAYLPMHQYLYVPTRDLWPAASVDGSIPGDAWPTGPRGERMKPSKWLDLNRPVTQLTWHPGEPLLIRDRIVAEGGWVRHEGATVFNNYRPPARDSGDATQAGPWRELLRRLYPGEAAHIERWFAHRVQRPGEKINHALVLGGRQGIGKDSLLEPVVRAVAPWNVSEVSPTVLMGRFNGYVKSVILRVSEARDMGDVDRYKMYDHVKTLTACPPETIMVDEKHIREQRVFNLCSVIYTSNHLLDGLYLPPDDRRHFVAWSEMNREDYAADHWPAFYAWLSQGGYAHVCAYLEQLDLSDFDPKAPPPRTEAFYQVVSANQAEGDSELADAIDHLGDPRPAALTIDMLIGAAEALGLEGLKEGITERKNRRALPHRLDRAGYLVVKNPDAADGQWKIRGRRQNVYARRELSERDRHAAVQRVIRVAS